MSFLAKLLGRKSNAPVGRELVPRAPRVKLESLHGVKFKVQGTDLHLELANLSTTGVGFLTHGKPWDADRISGYLEFGEEAEPYPCSVTVVRKSEILGCRIENISLELRRKIQEYFKLEIMALQMTAAPADVLAKQADGTPHWFHGRNNCELYYVSSPSGDLVRFRLTFFANYVEGAPGAPVRYGQVIEEERVGKPKYKGTPGVRWEERFPPELIELIRKFVANIPGLEAAPRDRILVMIGADEAR